VVAKLVLVNGMPGTGKSTLAERLHSDLRLPMLGKDMLKELLADVALQPVSEEAGRLLGKIATSMLYVYAEAFLAARSSVIIESAFWAEFARKDVTDILSRHSATCLELYCTTELQENQRRFMERIATSQRHGVHPESDGTFLADPETRAKYEPLGIGRHITIDTTHFGDSEYQAVLSQIKEELNQ
jgi:predicted kinase